MINSAKTKLYQKPVLSIKARIKELFSPELENPASDIGINIIACAKMIGITFAAFTFRGMYCRAPPYCLLPIIRFAYCTTTLRVPCTNRMAPAITNNKNSISNRNMTKPPDFSVTREVNSSKSEWGNRAIIPIKMINEIPLPIPLSVILSPSQRTNMLPPAIIIVEEILNHQSVGILAPALRSCTFRFTK